MRKQIAFKNFFLKKLLRSSFFVFYEYFADLNEKFLVAQFSSFWGDCFFVFLKWVVFWGRENLYKNKSRSQVSYVICRKLEASMIQCIIYDFLRAFLFKLELIKLEIYSKLYRIPHIKRLLGLTLRLNL